MNEATPFECPVVELRRYTLRPGARETLISLFERELLDPQEAVGMQVLGQFRDLDDPDAFVWLRGFRTMESRHQGLTTFYGGSLWAEHRDATNATLLDNDDVLLLRPVAAGSGLRHHPGRRLPPGAADAGTKLVVITTYPLARDTAAGFPEAFDEHVAPALREAGARVLGRLRTEHSPNTFPALPVREDIEAFVVVSEFSDAAAHAEHAVAPALEDWLESPPVTARLEPTGRSVLGA